MSIESKFERQRQLSTLTAAAGAASDALIVPDFYTHLAVSIHPGAGGTATLQVSLAALNADGGVDAETWIDWADGAVAVATGIEITPGLTAIRLLAAGAEAKAHINMLRES